MLRSSPGITARISRPFQVTLQNRKLFLEKFSIIIFVVELGRCDGVSFSVRRKVSL